MGRLTAALPWIGLGAVASIALANWLSLWILLLAPVLVVGGFLVWQLGPGRESFGWLTGLACSPSSVPLRSLDARRSNPVAVSRGLSGPTSSLQLRSLPLDCL
jgi:hypothetical protein